MKKMLTILCLTLCLTLCFGALAEQTPPADPAETAQTETAPAETAAAQDPTKEALEAYKALKKNAKAMKKLDALKEELDAYVADGKLTQEQADLVLKYYTEKLASHGEKSARKEQANGKPGGKGQQKQKNTAQTATNGKGSKHTKPADSGSTGTDTAAGTAEKSN